LVRLAEFPGERPIMREARLLDERDTREGPATDAHVAGFAEYLVMVVGSVYRTLRAGSVLRERGKVIACFYFGDAPSLSDAEVNALRLRTPAIRYEGNMLMIAQRDEARRWTRELGVLCADDVFADLMEQGY
jgi:hypothetical protein